MLVQDSGKHVREIISPDNAFLFQFRHVLFDELDNRVNVVFRIFQESEQKLHHTVAAASSHAVVGSVQEVYAVAYDFDGVGESELLVVVRVDSHFFSVLSADFQERVGGAGNLLRVERTVAVYDINRIDAALSQKVQRHFQILLTRIGERHDVAGGFVSLCVGVFNHINSGRDRINIGSNAD